MEKIIKLEEITRAMSDSQRKKYGVRAIILSVIGIAIFFCPFPEGDSTNILFGVITNLLKRLSDPVLVPMIIVIIVLNGVLSIIAKLMKDKENKLINFYKEDTAFNYICYIASTALAIMYWFKVGPEFLIGASTAGEIMGIVKTIIWTISLGAGLLTLLTSFGALEYVGTLIERFMRPVYNLPGKSGLDAMASFVGTSSVGVYMTSTIYKENGYTKRESCAIATCFSVVSITFATVCLQVADAMYMFPLIYLVTFIITFGVAVIMVRIPPISLKKNEYYNGQEQKLDEIIDTHDKSVSMFKLAKERAIGKAASVENVGAELVNSIVNGIILSIKAIGTVFLIGTIAMAFVEYTPLFWWIGVPITPVLELLQIPQAQEIAPATVIGFAEMFLPFLFIAELELSQATIFFVCVLGLVQIMYMSEVGAMIIITKLPISFIDMIVVFVIRTIICIPLIAGLMHLFVSMGILTT